MTKGRIATALLTSSFMVLWASTGWAWVWTDAEEDPLYGCSDTLHPDDEDSPDHVWESILETGIRADRVNGCDDCTERVELGFTFPFYEEEYTAVYISSNGFLSFVSDTSACCSGRPIPTAGSPNGYIAFRWDDLCPSGTDQRSAR